jgi:PAS domain S-box-containing protein
MAEDRTDRAAEPHPPARTSAEEALRDREELLRTLGDNLPDGFIYQVTGDPTGARRFTYISAGVERVLGVPPAEALADAGALYGLVHPDDGPRVAAAEAESLAGSKPFDCEFRTRTRAGDERWVHCRSAPQRLADGTVVWDGLLMDVTDRKRAGAALREGEERFHQLAESVPQLVWMARPDGHIFWYNRRWYEYTGTTPEQMAGWGWRTVHDPAVLPQVQERWKRSIATGEPFDMVFPLKGADGGFRPFLTRVMPLKDDTGRVVQWFGTNTDISEQKRAEDALREEARRKDRFISMLAHELRNPLAPIGNAMHLLARSQDKPVVDKVQEIVTRQVAHLSRIVDDLLEASRVARGQVALRRERVDLGRVVRQAAEDTAGTFEKAGVGLSVEVPETPVWVEGDRTRLTQVVTNLLANAAKFTDRGGRAAARLRPDGGQAVLAVTDTGVGMAAETVGRLFEPFGQADQSLARTRGGLGLGLALVKGFVELHGGTVTAASAGPGKGSEFTVRLPLAAEPPALTAAPRPTARPAAAARKRVLIVEDNKDSADSLKMVFEFSGYDVTVAYTGPDGAEAAKRVRPDLVICDIGLPGMDGYAVARRIRAELGPDQPVLVALTGYGEAADRERALAAGFDRHFTKPADPVALEAALTSRS